MIPKCRVWIEPSEDNTQGYMDYDPQIYKDFCYVTDPVDDFISQMRKEFLKVNINEVLRITKNLMFSTGHTDDNDIEIYKDDIVKFKDVNDDEYKIGKIIYQDCGCGFGYYIENSTGKDSSSLYLLSHYFDIEVIGNIFQNLELLNNQ